MKDILQQYKVLDKELTPAQQEELLTDKGEIDLAYLMRKHRVKGVTLGKAKQAVAEVFGQTLFNKDKYLTEVTQKEFNDHYSFGRYPDVRSWIPYFERALGKLLTREKLYEYTLNHRVEPSTSPIGRDPKVIPAINAWRAYLAPSWLLF